MSHYGTITTALDVAREHGSQRQAAGYMLEALVDRFSFADVLDMLADVATDKAIHLEDNWQDSDMAKRFTDMATKLGKLSASTVLY